MCNLYTIEKGPDAVRRIFADLQVPLEFPEGVPNFQPRDVRISERAPIVKFDRDRGVAQLVERRWSWPAPGGKPVFNMRSDGREFPRDRWDYLIALNEYRAGTQTFTTVVTRRAILPSRAWFESIRTWGRRSLC